jgi:hypothetical protein
MLKSKYDAGLILQIHTCLSYEYSMMLCINKPKLMLMHDDVNVS